MLKRIMTVAELLAKHSAEPPSEEQATSDRQRETQALQTAIKKLEDKEINLWRAFTEHGMRPQIYEQLAREYADERQRITAAIDFITKERGEVIDNLDAALAVISEIADRYSEHTPQRQRDILKQLVERVVVNPEGKIIRLELLPPFSYLRHVTERVQNSGGSAVKGKTKTSAQAGQCSDYVQSGDPPNNQSEPLAPCNTIQNFAHYVELTAYPQRSALEPLLIER